MAPDVLIHGDTHRSAALRHELPLGILDPVDYFEVDGRRVLVIAAQEASRVHEAAPGVEILDPYELGLDELIAAGMRWHELDIELCARAAARLGVRRLVVPLELSVGVADRLRADGLEIVPDEQVRMLTVERPACPTPATAAAEASRAAR